MTGAETTDNSNSSPDTLVFRGHVRPTSSPNSEAREDGTSTRSQATRTCVKADFASSSSCVINAASSQYGGSGGDLGQLAGNLTSKSEMGTAPFFDQVGERRMSSERAESKLPLHLRCRSGYSWHAQSPGSSLSACSP